MKCSERYGTVRVRHGGTPKGNSRRFFDCSWGGAQKPRCAATRAACTDAQAHALSWRGCCLLLFHFEEDLPSVVIADLEVQKIDAVGVGRQRAKKACRKKKAARCNRRQGASDQLAQTRAKRPTSSRPIQSPIVATGCDRRCTHPTGTKLGAHENISRPCGRIQPRHSHARDRSIYTDSSGSVTQRQGRCGELRTVSRSVESENFFWCPFSVGHLRTTETAL